MTSREQKKMQKKKVREKENRKNILAAREKSRAVVKKEKEERRREKRIEKLQKEMADFDYIPSDKLESMDNATLGQLERNVKILQALEKEYTDEMIYKKEINKSLEDEGNFTLEDKMASLVQKNIIKETSEVEVIKCQEKENS